MQGSSSYLTRKSELLLYEFCCYCCCRYTNAVVAPWYRPMEQANYYYVEVVCDDMTPASAFPDDNYTSFNEYFMKKYKLEIYNQTQPMLDVDYTTAR